MPTARPTSAAELALGCSASCPPSRRPSRRVLLSHTLDCVAFRSFVRGHCRSSGGQSGDVPAEMAYFGARDQQPAQVCRQAVQDADVYVVIAGVVEQDDQAREEPAEDLRRDAVPSGGGRSTGQLADRDNAYEQGIRRIKGDEY